MAHRVVDDGLSAALEAACGDELTVHPMGNAPLSHMDLDSTRRLFLWRYLYVSGEVQASGTGDYAWLTKDEIAERLGGEVGELMKLACGPFP